MLAGGVTGAESGDTSIEAREEGELKIVDHGFERSASSLTSKLLQGSQKPLLF